MDEQIVDRRNSQRFPLRLPLIVDGERIEMETRDVSSHGVSFYSRRRLAPGTSVEFTMTLPASLTSTEDIEVLCQGQVVRVDEQNDGRLAVAVRIEHYRFAADIGNGN